MWIVRNQQHSSPELYHKVMPPHPPPHPQVLGISIVCIYWYFSLNYPNNIVTPRFTCTIYTKTYIYIQRKKWRDRNKAIIITNCTSPHMLSAVRTETGLKLPAHRYIHSFIHSRKRCFRNATLQVRSARASFLYDVTRTQVHTQVQDMLLKCQEK